MTAVRNSAGTALASYSFDARSRRTGLTYTNGASADYNHRNTGREYRGGARFRGLGL
ncbi:MAG: hypothetical protein NTZ17_13150 [Phycisphaerae bacterium]|nr:hypothetical protein [Phycisphaerae bacterium]